MFIKTYITLLQFLSNPGGPYDIFNFRSIYEGWTRSEAFAYAKTYTLAGSNEVMCKYLGLVDM